MMWIELELELELWMRVVVELMREQCIIISTLCMDGHGIDQVSMVSYAAQEKEKRLEYTNRW